MNRWEAELANSFPKQVATPLPNLNYIILNLHNVHRKTLENETLHNKFTKKKYHNEST